MKEFKYINDLALIGKCTLSQEQQLIKSITIQKKFKAWRS